MKFFTLLAVVFTTAFSCVAQDLEGYYITTSGQKVEGFFKDADFTDTGIMQFKETRMAAYHTFQVNNVKEYGIGISHRFVRYTVSYDTSSSYETAGTAAESQWKESSIFLNVLAEGKLTLYTYYFKGPKFFYSVDGAAPRQLVYKKYKDANGATAVNEGYKDQLFNDAKCAKISSSDINTLTYTQLSLTAFTEKYNLCQKSKTISYTNQYKTEGRSTVSVFGGVRSNFFNMEDTRPATSKGSSFGWGAGVEAALKLSRDKWEVFARLEYEKIDAECTGSLDQGYNILNRTYTYKGSIFSMGLGPRYNILMNNSRIYIDATGVIGFPSGLIKNGDVIVPDNGPSYTAVNEALKTNTTIYFTLGIGYEFGGKAGVELRYVTDRNITDARMYQAKLGTIGLNLRYTVY